MLELLVQNSRSLQLLTEVLGITFALTALLYWYGTRSFAILKKINLPGPKPHAFLGNFPEIRKAGREDKYFLKCAQKYGKCFTTCFGNKVGVVIADPDILKVVMLKEFSNFRNRYNFVPEFNHIHPLQFSMLFARDERWKRIRGILTPSFTSAKLKQLTELMEACVDTLERKVTEIADTGKSVDMKEWYFQMSLDEILSTAFGVVSDVQANQDSLLLNKSNEFFQRSHSLIVILLTLPFSNLITKLYAYINGGPSVFMETASKAIRIRRQQVEQGVSTKNDMIKLMLTANQEIGHKGEGSKLSDDEIVAQSVTFLLAGQETTGNTLSFVTYLLALHPEVQEKLRSEIEEAIQTNPDKTLYDVIQGMEYLDHVVKESLRLYPPVHITYRECDESCTINGVYIPAGTMVVIPIYTLHHDPDAWSDAEKFIPERFTSPNREKIHPFQYMPFGSGPRNCIGLRFAYLEIKLTLVKLLRKFRFVRSPETQVPLQLTGGITLSARDGIYVRVESINNN